MKTNVLNCINRYNTCVRYFGLIATLFFSLSSFGQESALQGKIKDLQELLTSVEANKLTYVQEIKTTATGYYDYSVIEMDHKGNEKEVIYSFALSDINTRLVKSFTKKDVILIELSVTAKQKMIKKTSAGGDKSSYVASFFMYGLNAENGRNIEKIIKEAIPDAVELDKISLGLTTYDDYIKWLEANISSVSLAKKQIEQHLNTNKSTPGFITLYQTVESKDEERWELNLSHLTQNSVRYKISGSDFIIETGAKKGIKGIKHFVGDGLKDYQDKISFYANSAANGKSIYKVLKAIIPLAKEAYDKTKAKFESASSALKYINDHIAIVSSGENNTEQHFETNKGAGKIIIKDTKGDKNDAYEYNFDLSDINKSIIPVSSKKDKLFLVLSTNKGQSFIHTIKNDELQNYSKKFMLYFNSIDEALLSKEALQYLINEQIENQEKEENLAELSISKALNLLQKNISFVEGEKTRFDQHLEIIKGEENTLKFTKIEATSKKEVATIYEFSIADINWKGSNIKVSGKRVWAALRTKSSEKVIKTYEEGEVENYENVLEIEAIDIPNARSIIKTFKRMKHD